MHSSTQLNKYSNTNCLDSRYPLGYTEVNMHLSTSSKYDEMIQVCNESPYNMFSLRLCLCIYRR